MEFISKGLIDNKSELVDLVQIMAWHQAGDQPLSETLMVLLTNGHNGQHEIMTRSALGSGSLLHVWCKANTQTN